VDQVRQALEVSERRVWRVLGQPRSTHRYRPTVKDDEAGLSLVIIGYATQYGRRYGYRRITALLRRDGWSVNYKRVERICRRADNFFVV